MIKVPPGEVANTATNGVTLLLSLGGGYLLMEQVLATADALRIVGCAIFAASLVAVYSASTLSHAVASPLPRHWFRVFDQGFIYLLIAGSYTPFAVTYLRTSEWWMFLAVMWLIALGGLAFKLAMSHRSDAIVLWSYVLLGWLPVIPMIALIGTVPNQLLWWVLAGGASYMIGIGFFILDDRRFHSHAIWHTFALGGSACHFAAVFYYVATPVPGATAGVVP